jgi:glycosyltransferase involved in cell wall biosynthesis
MKVGFVSEHYPPTDGGVATSTQRVARHLHRLGAEVQVFCFDHARPLSSADYVHHEVDEGVRVARVGPFFLKQKDVSVDRIPEKHKATFRRRANNQMVHLLRQDGGADILLSFYLLNAGFLATFIARELGIPVVAGVRGNDIGRNIFHTERFAVTQWVVGGADRVVCVNGFLLRRLLLAFPDAAAKSLVIANTVSPASREAPERGAARRSMLHAAGWDAAAVVVTFIGTLREKKGVVTLVDALDRLGPDSAVRLLVIGPPIGNLERQLCGDAWDGLVGNGRIWCTGRLPLEAVSGWAAGADVVTMPSLDDGMANGLLEGMALGLCPVATEIFRDVVTHSESGIIVRAGDSAALAQGLADVASDASMRQRLGSAAREAILRRTPMQEAREYIDLFEEVLRQRQAAGRNHHA